MVKKTISRYFPFKGTGQPFELVGWSRLVPAVLGKRRDANLTVVLKNHGIHPQEMTKTIFSVLKVTEMALSNQSDFMQFLVSGKSSYTSNWYRIPIP
jgi:hypothetical protein